MSDLPPGWIWSTPPELAARERHALGIGPFGSDLKVSDYTDHGVPLVFVRNIRAESFGCESDRYISDAKAEDLRAHQVVPGDVLITKMGDPPGDACIYPSGCRPAVMTADCIRFRVDRRLCCNKFVLYAVRSASVRNQILAQTKGVAQKKISLERFASVKFPVAPLAEQARISDALDSYLTRLDAATEGLKRVEANLKRYRASVLKAAVEGRLVPTEAELAKKEKRSYEPASVLLERILKERRHRWEQAELAKMKAKGEIPKNDAWKKKYEEPTAPDTSNLPVLPEGWCWATVDQVGRVQLGRQRAPHHHQGANMRPYLRVANVYEDQLDLSDVMEMNFCPDEFETYRLEPGDILLNEGQSLELVGRPAMYRGEVPGACFQNTLIRFRAIAPLLGRYALTVFRAYLNNGRFQKIAAWTTNIAHLGARRFALLEFPLPPLAEQERIADEVERLLTMAETVARSTAMRGMQIARLRQAILRWAFEGKLVDQDPNDEPACVLLERIRREREAPELTKTPMPERPRRKSA